MAFFKKIFSRKKNPEAQHLAQDSSSKHAAQHAQPALPERDSQQAENFVPAAQKTEPPTPVHTPPHWEEETPTPSASTLEKDASSLLEGQTAEFPHPTKQDTTHASPPLSTQNAPLENNTLFVIEPEELPIAAETLPEAGEQNSWFQRFKKGLSRSSEQLSDSISSVFTKRKLDQSALDALEDILLQADLGLETSLHITETLGQGRFGKDISAEEIRHSLAKEIETLLTPVAQPLKLDLTKKPYVILVVGVNGTGKTTTIGKIAAKIQAKGLKVLLAAGDTFRAAAIEQLKIWGARLSIPVVSSKLGADAASLAFEAYKEAKAQKSDVLLIDTAGRLHNKTELMEELAKIIRVLKKHDADLPHTVLQTLDATTGQNALRQVEIFKNVAGVTGLVMNKLDGTARGGILVALAAAYGLPIHFIGVGEMVEDLQPFRPADFAQIIAGLR